MRRAILLVAILAGCLGAYDNSNLNLDMPTNSAGNATRRLSLSERPFPIKDWLCAVFDPRLHGDASDVYQLWKDGSMEGDDARHPARCWFDGKTVYLHGHPNLDYSVMLILYAY
jgi:hypothetical protein